MFFMENMQVKESVYTNKANRTYENKTAAKAQEEKELNYKEQLKEARERQDAEDAAQKKAQKKKQPPSPESAKVARQTSQQMLELLTSLAATPNIPANLAGGGN